MTAATTTNDTDDLSTFWKRLQELELQWAEQQLKDEIETFQKEWDRMYSLLYSNASSNGSNDDIIKINAGRNIIALLRSTLFAIALATATFLFVFSTQLDMILSFAYDNCGQVFLDHGPE